MEGETVISKINGVCLLVPVMNVKWEFLLLLLGFGKGVTVFLSFWEHWCWYALFSERKLNEIGLGARMSKSRVYNDFTSFEFDTIETCSLWFACLLASCFFWCFLIPVKTNFICFYTFFFFFFLLLISLHASFILLMLQKYLMFRIMCLFF
jgi:hypothetical protein